MSRIAKSGLDANKMVRLVLERGIETPTVDKVRRAVWKYYWDFGRFPRDEKEAAAYISHRVKVDGVWPRGRANPAAAKNVEIAKVLFYPSVADEELGRAVRVLIHAIKSIK